MQARAAAERAWTGGGCWRRWIRSCCESGVGNFLDYAGTGGGAGGHCDHETAVERGGGSGGPVRGAADLFLSAGGGGVTRAGLRPIARQTRAYFAAVDRVNGPTTIFDPSKDGGFELDAP